MNRIRILLGGFFYFLFALLLSPSLLRAGERALPIEDFGSSLPTVSVDTDSEQPRPASFQTSEWEFGSSPLSLPGRTFYVSPSGSDENGASESSPWQTIQHGVSQLEAGDTLLILEGIYEEEVDLAASGLPDALITIKGIGKVVLDGSRLPDYESALDTKGHDYLRFSNLTINRFRAAVDVRPGSQFIEIDGLRAEGNTYAVRINDASNVTVRNAYAADSNNAFRAAGRSRNLLFEDIEAYRSRDVFEGMNPDYLNGDGFILENDVSDVVLRRIVSGDHWDAGIDTKAQNVLIENAIVFGNKNNLKTWGTTTVRNLLSRHAKRELRSDGTTVEGNGITVVGGTAEVSHATFIDNEDKAVAVYRGGTLRLKNSIVARRNEDSTSVLLKNSDAFTSERVLWFSKYRDFSNLELSLTDFWADPEFADWDAGDYRLQETSLAVNYSRSDRSASSHDLDENPRVVDRWSDLGAYEYQTPVTPPFIGIANGDTVSGRIYVGPNLDAYPSVRQVLYYLDGNKIYTAKKKPFLLGGSKGWDTRRLKEGAHILTALFRVGKKKYLRFSTVFILDQNTAVSSAERSSGFEVFCEEIKSKKKRKKLGCLS